MRLRHGFKADARRIASDLRTEMGLTEFDPFDPFIASEDLGIPIYPFSKCLDADDPIRKRMLKDGRLSAMTIFIKKYRRIFFYDDTRTSARVVSDLSHEIAHALLQHPPIVGCGTPITDGNTDEGEAHYLGGVLLVSDDAAHRIALKSMDFSNACDTYGVSVKMMNYRLNVSGARKRMQRRQQRKVV